MTRTIGREREGKGILYDETENQDYIGRCRNCVQDDKDWMGRCTWQSSELRREDEGRGVNGLLLLLYAMGVNGEMIQREMNEIEMKCD